MDSEPPGNHAVDTITRWIHSSVRQMTRRMFKCLISSSGSYLRWYYRILLPCGLQRCSVPSKVWISITKCRYYQKSTLYSASVWRLVTRLWPLSHFLTTARFVDWNLQLGWKSVWATGYSIVSKLSTLQFAIRLFSTWLIKVWQRDGLTGTLM